MQPVKPEPIRLGPGHCCICPTICHHIGGPFLCPDHREAKRYDGRRDHADWCSRHDHEGMCLDRLLDRVLI